MAENTSKIYKWVCRKCGKKVGAKVKPGALYGGKCKASKAGTHSYVKA